MFTPLRIISGYSFLKSGLTVERISESIVKGNFPGGGISDFGVLYGAPSFVSELERINKKYLIGMTLEIEGDFYVAYALNEEGYRSLLKLTILISRDELDYDSLNENSHGLLGVLETNYGKFKEEFSTTPNHEFTKKYANISTYFDKFYLGLEVTSRAEFKYAQEIREFAKEHMYDTIAFPRIRYQKKEDALILTILNAVENNEKIETKEENGEQYFHDLNYYSKLYTKKEMDLTEELLNFSRFNFHQKRGEIAHFPVNDSKKTLEEKVFISLKEKGLEDDAHIARAKTELETINEMGYADYFLIVSDYVSYAKTHDILVGPGRGSAAGSLVSFALEITEVDPLKFDLQFERFLNKARKSMPDIDIDFMDVSRDQVVQYMRETYGYDKVANIATFQTIQAKQALRDIGRVYDIPTRRIDLLCKSITDKDITSCREAYKKQPAFRELVDSDKYFLEIVALASKIEGLPRQAGQHAAGIILNNTSLENSIPITVDYEGRYISQYEKDYLEEQGFLKMDFLSLTNLTAIAYCLDLIKEHTGDTLVFSEIPYDDSKSFELIRSGKTIGLFQIESSGMRNAIKIIQPKEFNDLVTLLAIFRPGPMDNIKDYANKKNGKTKVTYLNDKLKEILAPTYGVLIYQEQINKIAQVMAGFTPENADLFRRAISHKDKEVLVSSKASFISGSIKNGYTEKQATEMFATILKFADYGFNKSHAVAYAIIASRMAFLKAHYPLEFYSAILKYSGGTSDAKFSDYASEIKSRGYQIGLPNINRSTKEFIVDNNKLIFPLNMIKGINENVVNKIIDERMENDEYKDFYDFVTRCFKIGLKEDIILKLINAGALDSLYNSRATMRSTLNYAYRLSQLLMDDDGQMILDVTLENQKQYFKDEDIPLDNLNLEYESLGIMLSDNPLKYKRDLLKKKNVISINDAKQLEGKKAVICGIVASVKTIKVKKNNTTMAFVKIFDEDDEVEVTVFPRVFDLSFKLLSKNNILIINGRYESKNDKESFVADEISQLEE